MRTRLLLTLAVFLLLPGHMLAEPERGHRGNAQDAVYGLAFSEREQDLIRSYFRQHGYPQEPVETAGHKGKPKKQKRIPPGLQKKLDRGGELPPGWQKKLARGEVIDGELYAASQDLPEALSAGLGAGPVGTEIRRIEDEVVRLIEATGVIVDVLGL